MPASELQWSDQARTAREDLALVDPYLDADAAIGGVSLCKAVVDVGAQGLQGDGALVVVLGAGDLSAAQTARRRALMPLAPVRIARPMDCFIARRKEMRFSS